MKIFVKDYSLNVAIAFVCLLGLSTIYEHVMSLYYIHADISNFYVSTELIAEDVCYGDLTQTIGSNREVHGTKIGYSAVLVRELSRVNGGSYVKIYEEEVTPFIEKRDPGLYFREQKLPLLLKEGEYIWMLYPKINIHGQERSDIPPLVSNTFNVKICSKQE